MATLAVLRRFKPGGDRKDRSADDVWSGNMHRNNFDLQNQQAPALGLHLPTRRQGRLPDAPAIPGCVRVLEIGVVVDHWFIAFPLRMPQMNWLIDMVMRWSLLDDSEENRLWLIEILDAIESAFRRYCED